MSTRDMNGEWVTRPSATARSRGSAFTLIELLVVIAIILTLLSILTPAMKNALIAAEQAACASNLHQQGLALTTYVAEHRFYPAAHGPSSAGDIIAIWVTRIRKHASGGRDVFYCPSEPPGWRWQDVTGSGSGFATAADVANWAYNPGEILLRVNLIPFSYGYNDWGAKPHVDGLPSLDHRTARQAGLGGDIGFGGLSVTELPASRVASPAQMIAIADNLNTGSWRFNIDPTTASEWPASIHRGGGNFVFADGHVEWISQPAATIEPFYSSPDAWSAAQRALAKLWNNSNFWDPR